MTSFLILTFIFVRAASKHRVSEGHIARSFLEPAVHYATSAYQKILSFTSLGNFNASLYHSLLARQDSTEWKHSERVALDRLAERDRCLEIIRVKKGSNSMSSEVDEAAKTELKSLIAHCNVLSREIDIDAKEKESIQQMFEVVLRSSLSSFAQVLQLSPSNDLAIIFQVVKLWLTNTQNPAVAEVMHNLISKSPSYKFVPLQYQIISRLGSNCHQKHRLLLSELISKLCIDHPYHTLPQLFAILNEKLQKQSTNSTVGSERTTAAEKILSGIILLESAAPVVESTAAMLTAYISLAQASTSSQQQTGKLKDITFKEIQSREDCFTNFLSRLKTPPAVITLSTRLDPGRIYDDVVKVVAFSNKFSITESGVSRPKIIECEGSDGKAYKQLVKGGDDLRQDLVMQQVFETVNTTLRNNAATRERHLSIRTYKIIPLTSQTGVLEWVNNTIPFGSYLTDRGDEKGAHSRYYPQDFSHNKCRDLLKSASTNEERLSVFAKICDNLHPVFRFFFVENYQDPARWMSCRMAYTRSVAVRLLSIST